MKKLAKIFPSLLFAYLFLFLFPTVSYATNGQSKKIKGVLVCNTAVQEITTLPGENVMLAEFAVRHKLSIGETLIPLYSHALVIGKAQLDFKTKSIVKKDGVPQMLKRGTIFISLFIMLLLLCSKTL